MASQKLLLSGPMVTYSTTREVGLWVQLRKAGGAQVEYWEKGRPQRRWRTEVALTTGADHVATLVADSVRPGRKYAYHLWVADLDQARLRVVARPYPLEFQSQPLWQGRNDPADFRVVFGSGNFVTDSLADPPGEEPRGGQYGIFTAIGQQQPDLMIWLGDNTYLREGDWDSPTGIRRRYAHTRALRALQPLLGAVHHYATWDDHDTGPADADRSFALRETARETFRRYWPALAGQPGGPDVAHTFQWADAQFFLLDNRSYRTPTRDQPASGQFLGPQQLRWLTEALVSSTATFKIICVGGQVLNPTAAAGAYAAYETERAELLRRLAEICVPGVVFVSGDGHRAELTRLDRPGLYPLYELTTSPLTATPVASPAPNPLRDTATLRTERNFGLLDVSGTEEDRTLTFALYGAEGNVLWQREIRAHDLRPGPTPPIVPAPVAVAPAPLVSAVAAAASSVQPAAPAESRTRRPRPSVRARRPAADTRPPGAPTGVRATPPASTRPARRTAPVPASPAVAAALPGTAPIPPPTSAPIRWVIPSRTAPLPSAPRASAPRVAVGNPRLRRLRAANRRRPVAPPLAGNERAAPAPAARSIAPLAPIAPTQLLQPSTLPVRVEQHAAPDPTARLPLR